MFVNNAKETHDLLAVYLLLQDIQFGSQTHNYSMLLDFFGIAPNDYESFKTFGIRLDTQLTMYRGMDADIREEYVVQLFWKTFCRKIEILNYVRRFDFLVDHP